MSSEPNTESKSVVSCSISSSISLICSAIDSSKGLSNADFAFSLLVMICLLCVRRLYNSLRSVFFSVALDSRRAAHRLFSQSKLMLTLMASSFSVPNAKLSSEGEYFAG